MNQQHDVKAALIAKGVAFPCPESVEIGHDVDPKRISGKGVVIHGGCKIFGEKTLIGENCVVGYEGPAAVENCRLGSHVRLNGGFFKNSVFLDHVTVGPGAHVRDACIFEEFSSAAHTVGVKQTILFPYVTLGSLINFCDCLMAGGTGKKNHSEVGSSYIHFNFTPQQDKATPSLIGDVPNGVMLDKPPIFLGGQGGMVGPCRLAFGVTVAAGTIVRNDELRENRLIFGGLAKSGNIHYSPGAYSNIRRIFDHNVYYIANLIALTQWYRYVRAGFVSDAFPRELHQGLLETLHLAIRERLKRLEAFLRKAANAPLKLQAADVERMAAGWSRIQALMERFFEDAGDPGLKDQCCGAIFEQADTRQSDYLSAIHHLPESHRRIGRIWLQGIVDQVCDSVSGVMEKNG